MSTKVSVKGKLSPEHKTITKNIRDLVRVLDLPINSDVATMELVQAELISSMQVTAGKDMVNSVLTSIEFDAMKFYKFLGVLQTLSDAGDTIRKLHQEFYGMWLQLAK